MPKPIIDIDVNSEPFERFKKLFDQYVVDVKDVNSEWNALVANQNEKAKFLHSYADNASKAYQRLHINITRSRTALEGLASSGAKFLKTVERVSSLVLKWGAFGSIGTGLGLFGIDELANSVMERTRSARGAGLSVGQQSSFSANMGPILGSPSGFLGNVANAQQDYSKWWALAAMGINPQAAQGQSPFDLGLDIESRARAIWKQNPNLQSAQARGLTEFFSPEDLRRMGAMSDADFAKAQSSTRSDVSSLGFGDKQSAAWTELSVQLHKAAIQIETVLVDGLMPLAPGITDLSKAVADALKAFLGSDEIKHDMEDLGDGIKEFAKYVSSPEFRSNVKEFADDVGYMAKKVVDALKVLGLIPDKNPDNQPAVSTSDAAKIIGGAAAAGGIVAGPLGAAAAGGTAAAGVATANVVGRQIQEQIKKYGGFTDPDTGAWIQMSSGEQKTAMLESGGNPNITSRKGAAGLFQLMPATAAKYGVNPRDPVQAEWAYSQEMARLYKKYGDVTKAEAAYNWGEGNLDKDLAMWGAGWKQHTPLETRNYMDTLRGESDDILRNILRVIKTNPQKPGPSISISNNTASQVAIQANGAVSP